MIKPKVIVRSGDRFIVDEAKLLPSLKNHRDLVNSAVAVACQHYKEFPDQYRFLNAEDKLVKINEVLYSVLTEWGIYKGKK